MDNLSKAALTSPCEQSTTSDARADSGTGTAELANLAAILRNNIVVFDSRFESRLS